MVLVLCIGDLHIPFRSHDLPPKFKKLLVPGKIQQILCVGDICDRETFEYLRGISPDVRCVKGEYDENPNLPQTLIVSHPPLRIGVIHGHQVVPLGDTEALNATARKMDVDVLLSGATHRMECYEDSNRLFVNPGSATGAFSPFWIPSAPSSQPAEQPVASSDEGVPATAGNEEGEAGSKVNGDETSPKRSDGDSKDPTGEPTADNGEPTDEQSKPLPPSQPPTSSNSTYPPEPTPTFALLDIQGTVIVTYIYQLVAGEVKVDKFEFRRVG